MKSTGNKTYDQISHLITERPYSMNTLKLSFPYSYAASLVDLNWYDIFLAIKQGYLDHRSAIEHAQLLLECDEYSQTVLDLACIYPEDAIFPHSIDPYISELADTVSEEEKDLSKDKIMYVLLRWVYEHGSGLDDSYYDDPLNVVESIFDDFGFPESIARFASWRNLPISMVEQDLGSVEKNKARLLEYWKQFLDEQQKRWKKVS